MKSTRRDRRQPPSSPRQIRRIGLSGRLLCTPADGSCLFHGVSIALAGSSSLTTELGYRAALMTVLQPHKVQDAHARCEDISTVGPDHIKAIIKLLACSSRGRCSSAWTIMVHTSLEMVDRDPLPISERRHRPDSFSSEGCDFFGPACMRKREEPECLIILSL